MSKLKIREIAPTLSFHLGLIMAGTAIINGSTRLLAAAVMCMAFSVADINDRGWMVQGKVIPEANITPKSEEGK